MASNEAIEFANFFATLRTRFSDPGLDLPTIRDVTETVHLASKEPEGVNYVEANVGGVEALWCVPAGSDDSARSAVLMPVEISVARGKDGAAQAH